ncbi:uncharacterized protein A4U43_C10F10340 [Asparagus officinalis]|uniref:Uncharacterized protein n=1 Tax=Asparagus officinalis TaxID=4686 RepID=A0A5P1E1U4_ASPOF|nr:uncharacterized protein A4U43_C10F10340 [Asparagus officinalis]
MPCITFSQEDMHVRNPKHDRPLYFTGYIGSIRVDRIQVDPGSALSIIPLWLVHHLGVPLHHLSTMRTTIYNFNASNTRPLGKTKLTCQMGDLRTDVTCYVIDAETSYNLEATIQGVENYFTDSIHYLDVEPFEVPLSEEPDSGNEADIESEYEQGLVFNDIEHVVIGLEDLDVNDPVYEDSGVIFNNNDLAYFSRVELNPNMPGTNADVIADPLSKLYAESNLYILIQSSFITNR